MYSNYTVCALLKLVFGKGSYARNRATKKRDRITFSFAVLSASQKTYTVSGTVMAEKVMAETVVSIPLKSEGGLGYQASNPSSNKIFPEVSQLSVFNSRFILNELYIIEGSSEKKILMEKSAGKCKKFLCFIANYSICKHDWRILGNTSSHSDNLQLCFFCNSNFSSSGNLAGNCPYVVWSISCHLHHIPHLRCSSQPCHHCGICNLKAEILFLEENLSLHCRSNVGWSGSWCHPVFFCQ